eukprot:862643-Amphidinium_carterae.1
MRTAPDGPFARIVLQARWFPTTTLPHVLTLRRKDETVAHRGKQKPHAACESTNASFGSFCYIDRLSCAQNPQLSCTRSGISRVGILNGAQPG